MNEGRLGETDTGVGYWRVGGWFQIRRLGREFLGHLGRNKGL